MKYFTCVICFINFYIGSRFFLNVIHVLNSSKYSKTATLVFALLFLAMGVAGLYFCLFRHNYKLALIIGTGPWILALLFLLLNMMTADYK